MNTPRREWLTMLLLITVFSGCSSPTPILPKGDHRVPVNSEEVMAQYRERVTQEQQERQERTLMGRQIEVLRKQLQELRAYLILMQTEQQEAERGRFRPVKETGAAAAARPATSNKEPAIAKTQRLPTRSTASSSKPAPEPAADLPMIPPRPADAYPPVMDGPLEDWREPVTVSVSDRETMEVHRRAIIFRLSHGRGATRFAPSSDLTAYLAKAIRTGQCIQVRGYTDGEHATAAERRVAQQRADQARVYLISQGVAPMTIDMKVYPVGEHVANNTTEGGRAQNRRVEIEVMDVDPVTVWPAWKSERRPS